jgi:hypothetical protein
MARSTDYQFGIVTQCGNGKATVRNLKLDKKDELEIKSYGEQPFRLAKGYLQKWLTEFGL